MKRGVKTSYGNYTQLRPQSSFVNNKFKLQKNRKSMITTGNLKQNTFYMNPKGIDSFK